MSPLKLSRPLLFVYRAKDDWKPQQVINLRDSTAEVKGEDLELRIKAAGSGAGSNGVRLRPGSSGGAASSVYSEIIVQASNDHDLAVWMEAKGGADPVPAILSPGTRSSIQHGTNRSRSISTKGNSAPNRATTHSRRRSMV